MNIKTSLAGCALVASTFSLAGCNLDYADQTYRPAPSVVVSRVPSDSGPHYGPPPIPSGSTPHYGPPPAPAPRPTPSVTVSSESASGPHYGPPPSSESSASYGPPPSAATSVAPAENTSRPHYGLTPAQ
jgi:hypothetical protein